MSRKYRVSFILSRDGGEDVPLRCRLLAESSRTPVSLNVGFRVDPARWDKRMQRCVPGSFHGKRRIPADIINREIDRFVKAAADAFLEFDTQGIVPTTEQLRKAFRAQLGLDLPDVPDLLSAMDAFVREQSHLQSWAPAMVRKFNQTRRNLRDFGGIVRFEDVTRTSLLRYVEYMRDELHYLDSTVSKHLGYLRWFLKWAEERRYISSAEWKYFRPKLRVPPQQIIYLTWPELMRVWEYQAPERHPYLNEVRDIFLFCCFTSLRYSDAVNVRWSDFDGNVLNVTTVKTADTLRIEMNKWSNEILGRYIDTDFGEDRVFRKIPNQVMNRYLKEICRSCGIDSPVRVTKYRGSERIDEVKEKWEVIGTHAGRRTFVCNALSMGISPQVVMKWTGHSDYKAMKPYIDVTDSAKASAMGRFDEL